jgi:hypothetical protein
MRKHMQRNKPYKLNPVASAKDYAMDMPDKSDLTG